MKSTTCSGAKPTYCINKKDEADPCVAGTYLDCGMPEYDCPSTAQPLRCLVSGTLQCVRGHWECDCPSDMFKCAVDNKCVAQEQAEFLCPTVFPRRCPEEFPYLCPDSSCKRSREACASQPGCPPGFMLCPDQTCVDRRTACPNEYAKCPADKFVKCEDQSCVSRPEECPTRITCQSPDQIICPDKTCAWNELQCRLPPTCPQGWYLCPDQSCRPSLDDCPKPVSCPENYAKCEDGSCSIECKQVL